jgi:hypothetical protein
LDLPDPVTQFCGEALPANSIFAFLHAHREVLFPDNMFADLFATVGRRSVPPSVVATVMVLQRLEGLSDREAVDRFTFDARWRYAAGVGGWDGSGRDTITLIRSAVRGLLAAADGDGDGDLVVLLRAAISSGDDYASPGKPVIDWDDKAAREALVDSRARDGYALLAVLDGRQGLPEPVAEAMRLLATVLGQDLETGPDGAWRRSRRPSSQGGCDLRPGADAGHLEPA